jgi:hypothetical protein
VTAAVDARRQPANSKTDDEGSRWYIHPQTGEKFLSVTTALKIMAKEKLIFWAAGSVAAEAMEQLPTLVRKARIRPCERTGEDRCRECRACAVIDLRGYPMQVRDEAANLGSRVHTAAERYALTGELDGIDEDVVPFIDQYLAFHRQYRPTYEAAEMTVISREFNYAGTLDGIVRLGWCPPKHKDLVGKALVKDTKSGKGVYDEAAMQLAAYKHAEAILLPDGTELPMPATEDTAIVLHLRPDDYWVHPVPVGQRMHGGFLTALALYTFREEHGTNVIGRAMYKPPLATAEPKPAAKPRKAAAIRPAAAEPRAAAPATERPDGVRQNLRSWAQIRDGFAEGAQLTDDDIPF